jgi:hypothetical protein
MGKNSDRAQPRPAADIPHVAALQIVAARMCLVVTHFFGTGLTVAVTHFVAVGEPIRLTETGHGPR